MSALAVITGFVLLAAVALGVVLWAMCEAASRADDQAADWHRAACDRADAITEERRARLAEVQADLRRRRTP